MSKIKELERNMAENICKTLLPLQPFDFIEAEGVTYGWNEYHDPRVIVEDGNFRLIVDFDKVQKITKGYVHDELSGDTTVVKPGNIDRMAGYMLSIIEDPVKIR